MTTVPEAPDLAGYKIKTPTNSGIMPPMKHCEGIADKLSSPPGHGATCSAVTKYDLGGRLGVIRGDRIELLWARTNPNGGTCWPDAAVRFVLSFG